MKSIKLSALVAALALGVAGSASALTLTAGNYKIIFDNFDSGTLYGTKSDPGQGVLCNSVAACDSLALTNGTRAPGSVGSVNGTADTMGILSIASIHNNLTNVDEFIRGTSSTIGGTTVGPFLTGVFGNLRDQRVTRTCDVDGVCTVSSRAVGGTFKIWSNSTNFDSSIGPTVSANVDLNAGLYSPSVSGGSLFLEGVFAAGAVVFGDLTTSYTNKYDDATIAGNGQGYLDFTGGLALPFFDTNSLTNVNGGKNDAFLTTTFDDANGNASSQGWTASSAGQIKGSTKGVPEPTSVLLAGVALLGLGAASRRRVQK